ncbi:MAG TPA: T9SS type A sorting domain-containing protein [Bacteroidia bacterium]|nr:T9SS type A sorting domain-containing protein [Bacteroidia bacterium]
MKKLVLIAMVLTGLSARAQFFEHLYGTTNPDVLTCGVNVLLNPTGHIVVGENELPCFPGIYAIPVAYTDVNGNIPAGGPYFKRDYTLLNSSGGYLIPEDAQVYELQNGSGFGIVGKYTDPSIFGNPNTGVFYLRLDGAGNVLGVNNYPALGGGGFNFFNVEEVGGITESVSHGILDELFITGTVRSNNNRLFPFAMKLDVNTGAMFWSHVYQIAQAIHGDAWGKDIADGLLPHHFVTFAGHIFNTTDIPNSQDGFIQHIDRWNGMPAHPTIFYGTPTSSDLWNSINATSGPMGPPPMFPFGYVLGGATDMYGSMDFNVLRMDMVIAPFWSSTFDYSVNSNAYDECTDVIERFNSLNQWEYYATGFTDNGIFGGFDVLDVKMDFAGVAVPGGEFTYGGSGNDYGVSIDQLNIAGTANPDGLSTFGTWGSNPTLGGEDMYHIKSYYNGLTSCNDWIATNADLPGMMPGIHVPSQSIANFNSGNIMATFLPISDFQLCWANFIGGGNNARTADPGDGTSGTNNAILVPNPAENGNTAVKLNVESSTAGEADVTVYDMMGKQVYSGTFNLKKGKNALPVDLTDANLSSGMYTVKISGSTNETLLLQVK